MKNIKYYIGCRIIALRKAKKLTQLQLAEAINIHENNLGSIERGENGISMDTLMALSTVLDVDADYILFGERKKTNNTPIQNLIAELDSESQADLEEIIKLYIKAIKR